MSEVKAGEIRSDGRSVTIGAPAIRAVVRTTPLPPPPPRPSETLALMLRHLKGVVAAGEDLLRGLEAGEKK